MAPKEPSTGRGDPGDLGSDDDDRSSRPQSGPVPRPPPPARTTTSTGSQPGVSAPRVTGQQPAQRPTVTGTHRATGTQSNPAARAVTSGPQPGPKQLTAFQRQQLGSAFASADAERRRKQVLGAGPARAQAEDDDDEVSRTNLAQRFDGKTAPSQLTGRDLWKAVQAPIQSREGRRDSDVYQQVINQFAVGTNPRYEPDAPERPRGHIFVWDVSRAMNCEIPHFAGAKELTLAQTVDWVRHEGPMRGWVRLAEHDVFDLLETGQLVIALPRDIKLKQIAVVGPQRPQPDGKPLLTGAGRKRGAGVPMIDLFGVRLAEFFTHA